MGSRVAVAVRPAEDSDLAAILAVRDRHEGVAVHEPTTLERATWREIMATVGLTTYVADADGQVVGAATLLVMPNLRYACAPTAFIEAVVVDPASRRRGVATALLERMLADADAAGCNKVQLLAHKRHAFDGAHALYEKAGFTPEAEGFRRYLRDEPAFEAPETDVN